MNQALIEIRNLFLNNQLNYMPDSYFKTDMLKRLSKPDRAQLVYRYHKAGGQVGTLCGLFEISSSYYRELKQVNEKEWHIKLLTDDENFTEFVGLLIKEVKTGSITEADFDKWIGLFSGTYIISLPTNADTPELHRDIFLEIIKMDKTGEPIECLKNKTKNADTPTPQPINYIPSFSKISTNNEKERVLS